MHVLMVADDPTASRGIKLMFARAGCCTCLVADRAEATALAKPYGCDLILPDLASCDMAAHKALRRLRRDGVTGLCWS